MISVLCLQKSLADSSFSPALLRQSLAHYLCTQGYPNTEHLATAMLLRTKPRLSLHHPKWILLEAARVQSLFPVHTSCNMGFFSSNTLGGWMGWMLVCRGFGMVKTPQYQMRLSWWHRACMGTWGHCCDTQTGEGRQSYRAGSGHPCPLFFPKHGLKNRCKQVSKRKRNEEVKCHDLRHALRPPCSPHGSPSLGLPLAFPDQEQPRHAPWAQPSAVTSVWDVLPFRPSLSALMPYVTSSLFAWRKAPAPGFIPSSSLQLPYGAITHSDGAPDGVTLSPTQCQVGSGRHPVFSLLKPYKHWVSMAGPCGHAALPDFVHNNVVCFMLVTQDPEQGKQRIQCPCN